mmetsp:Transcript_14902/g.42791  ORF Transcript_14902/g.42791 Transcript_14902/m.42791 type:complete len:200 (+) Transcript_14902:1014-1613(+)
MVRVDVRKLDAYQVGDHSVGGFQAVLDHAMCHLEDLLTQAWEPLHLHELALRGKILQLFINQVHALQGGVFQLLDLPLHESLEGDLRDELWPGSISHRDADLKVRESAEGIKVQDRLCKKAVEDVVQACSADELVWRHLVLTVGQAALERIAKVPHVPRDQVQQEGALAHPLLETRVAQGGQVAAILLGTALDPRAQVG